MNNLVKSDTLTIGGNSVRLQDSIENLLIDKEISWPGCPEEVGMEPTECEWDFSGMPLEKLIRLAWNTFKVQIRSKYFKKLLEEGGLENLHEKTRSGLKVRVIDALNYDFNVNQMERRIIDRVVSMLDVGASKKAVFSALSKRYQCGSDEAEYYYERAKEEV